MLRQNRQDKRRAWKRRLLEIRPRLCRWSCRWGFQKTQTRIKDRLVIWSIVSQKSKLVFLNNFFCLQLILDFLNFTFFCQIYKSKTGKQAGNQISSCFTSSTESNRQTSEYGSACQLTESIVLHDTPPNSAESYSAYVEVIIWRKN